MAHAQNNSDRLSSRQKNEEQTREGKKRSTFSSVARSPIWLKFLGDTIRLPRRREKEKEGGRRKKK
jgi:hypothetical protein